MYLKSIEVQGFKSFANKIIFDFHNGITGIVGPNGSGKSNVADAVRWVLGEQSAKQLRGSNMQDVIFSGTENRKPLSYAYVAITLDNSDKKLVVDYEEVTVARRVYRSGESEYLMNGSNCRLKDIQELFYDTGIGKEGYSIIGQGQIDKILSGKPEERRELFDEAAGIVKFKRRKGIAVKKLEDEKKNLIRVNDILSELEKQVGPLEKQSEVAKSYLNKKEELKKYDVNLFLMEMQSIQKQIGEVSTHIANTAKEFESVSQEYEKGKQAYDQLEEQLNETEQRIQDAKNMVNETAMKKQQLTADISLLKEQIHSAQMNEEHLQSRREALLANLADREGQKVEYEESAKQLEVELAAGKQLQEKARNALLEVSHEIAADNAIIEKGKSDIVELLNERSSIQVKLQRCETLLEQIQIRKAELSQKLLKMKSDESEEEEQIKDLQQSLDQVLQKIETLSGESTECASQADVLQQEIKEWNQQLEVGQTAFHRESSRLESLRNITERYSGYGNSIRKVMECKEKVPGIHGVTADLIKVEKEYEVAIETALGGNIQNIVTDTEDTAKKMIAYLKKNQFGRATFLPLTSMNRKSTFQQDQARQEPGVIGLASELVQTSQEYKGLANYLLGRTLVVDHIDHAIAIARKYHYSIRMVTLEGESLNPGGSMTGGAFKNTSNLLGRRREIEELEKMVTRLKGELEAMHGSVDQARQKRDQIRAKLVEQKEQLQKLYLEKNTLELNIRQRDQKKQEALEGYADLIREAKELEVQAAEIHTGKAGLDQEREESFAKERLIEQTTDQARIHLEEKQQLEQIRMKESEEANLQAAAVNQQQEFLAQNIERVLGEMERIREDLEQLATRGNDAVSEIESKEEQIKAIHQQLQDLDTLTQTQSQQVDNLIQEKETYSEQQKQQLKSREELAEQKSRLDKEQYRLNAQMEKLEDSSETNVNYMWEEYELTWSQAEELRAEETEPLTDLKANVSRLRNEIRKLGHVNVNSIEEYKEVSQRYEFLKKQQEDLLEAEETLHQIISELDEGMRKQFTEKFQEISAEFDKVFRQLFGGGKGTLELVEAEDILEAGIRIISQPPGKKLQNMMQLSGGEKALTAIALLFAIQNLKPSPFCLLDEIEAALDDSNVGRFAEYLHRLTKHTQFIVITHRRGTMAAADRLYGITMQEKGVSTLVSVNLIEDDLDH